MKGGKIDKRAGRTASPAARLAPLLGWVGGKAWLSAGCTIENVPMSPRKQTTYRHAAKTLHSPVQRWPTIKDDTLWLRNPTIFNLPAHIHIQK